jgi:hypothetical protein
MIKMINLTAAGIHDVVPYQLIVFGIWRINSGNYLLLLLVLTLASFTVPALCTQLAGLLEWGSARRKAQENSDTEESRANIRTSRGIQTRDPSV